MSRLERLINLISALLETERPLSREAIQQRVPGYAQDEAAFRRTFERDKSSLRDMGVPVITVPIEMDGEINDVGYRIVKDEYALADPGLSQEEMEALALAAASVRLDGGDIDAQRALAKLGAEQREYQDERSHALELANDERLSLLFHARTQLAPVRFAYREKQRHLEVHRLSCRQGRWYVIGFDIDARDLRTYRLDRMTGPITVEEPTGYEVSPQTTAIWAPSWEMGDATPVIATVAIDNEFVEVARRQGASHEVSSDEQHTVFSFSVRNEAAFRSFVLGFLSHAELKTPSDMRSRFVEWVRQAIDYHTRAISNRSVQ